MKPITLTPLALCVVVQLILGAVPARSAGSAGSGDEGRALYAKYCVACHGVNGDGHGPAAGVLDPHPADFTDARHMKLTTDADLVRVIKTGFPRSAMPAWRGKLSDAQIEELVNYIRSLRK